MRFVGKNECAGIGRQRRGHGYAVVKVLDIEQLFYFIIPRRGVLSMVR